MREWNVPGFTEVRTLGSGGFGDVVLARQDSSGALVAIKYLHRALLDDPEFAGMFRAEASVLASLDDPNVVRLYEYIESPSGAAIVMELVDGVSLREILSRHGKTQAEAALVVLQGSLLGLAAAHARGVVHRDYKPANVLVNGAGVSKLTDFGIAARAGDRPMPAGTLKYAPPEQFEGTPASPAGDVYAATVTFYECLTGEVPFTGETATELYDKHKSAPVPLGPIPEPLRPIVARGLAKSPLYRPSNAARLAEELRAAAAGSYGRDWEDRGRSHLGEAALLLAALWPSGTAPAVQGQTVEQVHLSHNPQPTHDPQHARHLEHLRHLEHQRAEHIEHAEHVRHLEHLQHEHAEHVRHVEHLEHLSHLEHEQAGQGTAGHGTSHAARRTLHTVRQVMTRRPAVAIGAAAVVVAAVAGVAIAASSGSGASPLSIAGAWSDGQGGTFTFTSSGPVSYTVSLKSADNPKCAVANDGTVTGSNGHFSGTIDLYPQPYNGPAGSCPPKTGLATITIVLSANGKTASIDDNGDNCSECGEGTWSRES
jgi:serine/threonine protein kinase